MLMIIIHHFAYGDNFHFPADSITLNRLWIQFVNMGGKLGVNIFVLLSGYFLIESKSVKFRKLVSMWMTMLFYSITCYILSVLAGRANFRAYDMLLAFMPLSKTKWWFLEVYFMLYLLHPYLNAMLRNLTKAEYQKMLLILGFCWSVMPTFTNSYLASGALSWFIYLYCISGYIRLWNDNLGNSKYIWLSVLLIMMNFLFVVVFDVIGIKTGIRMFVEHPLHWYNMQMLPMLVIPVCMLIGFKHLSLKYNRIINTIASATLGVYIIHTDRFISMCLWKDVFRTLSFQDSSYLIPYSIAAMLTVYISCTVIELIRAKAFKILSGGRFS